MSGFKITQTRFKIALVLGFVIIGGLLRVATRPIPTPPLIISTTTSLYETGLLDELKERFESENPGATVLFISQGTGLAIETARRGDADMILVHSPSQEKAFLEGGHGVNRKVIAYNFFIVVGPNSDPAGIRSLSPLDALLKLQEEGIDGNAVWVSRGDNSGTHSKEKDLWGAAGLDLDEITAQESPVTGAPWYIEAGAGMTATLQLTNEKDAYTLTDMATYLKNHENGNIELVKVVDSGRETLNVYSAILCNPEVNPGTNYDIAKDFIKFLLTDEVQDLLEVYGVKEYGETLFKPWIPEQDNPESEIVQWVAEYAFIEGTECPEKYRYKSGDFYG